MNAVNHTQIMVAVLAALVLASCTLNDTASTSETVGLYYAPNACGVAQWYPRSEDDVARAEEHFADQGIDARITYVDRHLRVYCEACMTECSHRYFTAEVAESDVESMHILGWTSEHPFPNDPPGPGERLFGLW